MKQRWQPYLMLLMAILVIGLLSACSEDEKSEDSPVAVRVGDLVPDFAVVGTAGQQLTSASLRGRVCLLTFFDTGCGDCRRELPVLQQIYDRYHGDVVMIQVPRSQSLAEVQDYWTSAGLTLPVYAPIVPSLYYKFASSGIPRTYIIDREGIVRAVMTDSPLADYATFEAALLPLLGSRDEEPVEEGYTRLAMKVNTSVPLLGDTQYFENEHLITCFELYLFDASTKQYVTKLVIDNPADAEKLYNTPYDITYLFRSQRIKVGVYDLFAVANYYAMPKEIGDEQAFLNIIDSVSYEDGIEPYIQEQGAIMTSRATSLMNVDMTPYSGRDCEMVINMERVLAKLEIGISQEFFELQHAGTKYADIKITNYKFVNLNTRFYLFQHTDKLTSLGAKPEFQLPGNYISLGEEGSQYVVDPLFYDKKPDATSAQNVGKYYASWFGAFNTDNFASIPPAGTYGYAYILENTAFNTSQKNGYSTGIVFKASVSPVFVYLYDPKTFALVKEYRPEYWGDVVYYYNYNFYGSIQAINVVSGLMLDELMPYTDKQLLTFGIKRCRFNQGVYETYYTYWIRHRANSSVPMGPMQYGIVRNNFYQMTITGVSGIGHSEIIPEVLRDNYPNSYVDMAAN